VLGFSNIDGKGIEGIERAMNELLTGRQGELPVLRDARGRMMLSESDTGVIPGASVHLTLDRTVQHYAETAILRAVAEHKAQSGTAVVLEVGTGRVLALASAPTYDPNNPAGAVAAKARNRAVTDAFEIGSPMKIFTVAAALEAGAIRPNQVIDTENGRYRVGRKMIVDSHHDPELDITGIIKRSSNVGAVKIAQALGREKLHEALVRYGFGAKTNIELPGERSGLVRPHKRWGDIGLATASFGYGMLVTPLQVAAAFSAIVNHGVFIEPRIVAEVRDADGKSLYRHQVAGRQMLSPHIADLVRDMSASVFEKGRKGGTARDLDVAGYNAGGKTGTAHKIDPATGRYADDLYLSSFVGAAPIEDPRIVVLVLIDEPHGEEYYGAKVAGPAFAEIASETLRYLGVPLQRPIAAADADSKQKGEAHKASAHKAAEPAVEPAVAPGDDMPATDVLTDAIDGIAVPDFAGLSIVRALELAHDRGISLEVSGSGVAVSQHPQAGVPAPDATCRVVFSPGY
jgi:cell division protein FtsI (penicillin-binding protein 3)